MAEIILTDESDSCDITFNPNTEIGIQLKFIRREEKFQGKRMERRESEERDRELESGLSLFECLQTLVDSLLINSS